MDPFLVTRYAMAALMPFVFYRLRRRALARTLSACRPPTSAEQKELRQNARDSVLIVLAFWTVNLGMVTALALLQAPRMVEWAGVVPMVAVGATWVSTQLRVVCPVCSYPLAYQKPVGVPSRCERCGADLLPASGSAGEGGA